MSHTCPSLLTRDRLPSRLSDLTHSPPELYVRGELPRGPAVAIVGTRSPTPAATRFAKTLARDLASAGVAVLSGGARGIDSAAHQGALAARGVTVVVAPAGFLAPYPEENAPLFRRVVRQGGAYVSLVPDDRVAERSSFFARNACLAALSHAVVIVQAPLRSGARNAAAWARKLHRPLLVVPSAPWIEQGRGCLVELRLGGRICESSRSVLEVLAHAGHSPIALSGTSGSEGPAPSPPRPVVSGALRSSLPAQGQLSLTRYPLDSVADRVHSAIQSGVHQPDDLCQVLGLSVAQVQRALLTLRLGGVLVPGPGGGFDQ